MTTESRPGRVAPKALLNAVRNAAARNRRVRVLSHHLAGIIPAGPTLRIVDFGALNYTHTMRWVIPGVMLTALGFQTILFSFFGSLLGMRRR